jgi:MFS family permease
MLTMPIAGVLVDKIPVGRIVPVGLLLIIGGMFGLTRITSTTSYPTIIVLLVIMGLGMGGTMMPIFTTALRTLTHHEVARGSTLLNITQQIASSVGVATMSVILTNHIKESKLAGPAMASFHDPSIVGKLGGQAALNQGLADAADAFAKTFWVAAILVALTLVPAYFLPRRRQPAPLVEQEQESAPPVLTH